MTITILRNIFIQCNRVLNHSFNILGVDVTLYKIIAFELFLYLVFWIIFYLFHHR